jgi:hypothetical protein
MDRAQDSLNSRPKTDREQHRSKIAELVSRYDDAARDGTLLRFSEADVGSKFVLPLLEALGWNTKSIDEVKEQKRTLTGPADYSLNIRGAPRIVVEIKKFTENLDSVRLVRGKQESYAYQATRYAWHLKADWCVLTNFKELRLYYAHTAKPEDGLVFRLLYDHYLGSQVLEQLFLLSKESVLSGRLDTLEKRRTRSDIDEEILNDLFEFRRLLLSTINRNNSGLSTEFVRECVQKILDRILVIRVAEDREIIGADSLWRELESWQNRRLPTPFMRSLKSLFRDFDEIYNSRLFEPHSCEDLTIDNTVLSDIITSLYKYNFDLISADVLGAIYEDYIGHILSEIEGKVELIESRDERRRGGIYYTPVYVVEYIARNTLGNVLKKCRTPEDVSRIKVLDPACGSGSFLIKCFDIIREWYDEWNRKSVGSRPNSLENHIPKITDVELKIINENLYGVDLDPQAAEIASVNLMLKALRKETKLPKILGVNIKIGNSLVSGSSEELRNFMIDAESIKAFSWEKEFPQVFEKGGFDIVLGNPPYINAIELSKTIGSDVKNYWKSKYEAAEGAYDIYVLFFEQALNLTKKGGLVSFITPNKYLSSPYAISLRRVVAENHTLKEVNDLSKVRVFQDPSVYPAITIIENAKPRTEYQIATRQVSSENIEEAQVTRIPSRFLTRFPDNLWGPILSPNARLIEKIFNESVSLIDAAEVQATSTAKEADTFSSLISEKKGMPIINTGTIDRYSTTYGTTDFMNKGKRLRFPKLDVSNRLISDSRRSLYKSPKIVIAKLALRIEGFYDRRGEYASINTNCIHSPKNGYNLHYLLALVNSKLLSFVYSELFKGLRMSGGYFQFQAPQLRILPIRRASDQDQKVFVPLTEKMISLGEKLNSLVASFERYWEPVVDQVPLRRFSEGLAVSDREIVNPLAKGEIENLRVEESSDWLSFIVDYSVSEKGEKKRFDGITILRCRFKDEDLRRFIMHVILKYKKKMGTGNLSSKVLEVMIPRFDKDERKNRKAICRIMNSYLRAVRERERLEEEIRIIDGKIDDEAFRLYGLTSDEISIINSETATRMGK